MPADPLPWSERLRRRNGLPPREPFADLFDALGESNAAQIADHQAGRQQPSAITTVGQFLATADLVDDDIVIRTERDDLPNLIVRFTADVSAARCGLGRCAAASERRCPHDLPTTMCHHCQETHNAQP